jgi:hypothetical protein
MAKAGDGAVRKHSDSPAIVIALDGDRPVELSLVITIQGAKNSRGKQRARVSISGATAKRGAKKAAE